MATYTNRVPKRRVDNSQTVYGNSSLHFRGKVFFSASSLAMAMLLLGETQAKNKKILAWGD